MSGGAKVALTPTEALVTAVRFSSTIRIEVRGGQDVHLELNLERSFDVSSASERFTVDLEGFTGLDELLKHSLYRSVHEVRMFADGAIEVELGNAVLRCEGGDDYEAWELVVGDRDQTYVGGVGRQLVIFDATPSVIHDPSHLPGIDL